MSGTPRYLEAEFPVKHETARAILIVWNNESHWLPKSQIEYKGLPNGNYLVKAPEWLLRKKGLV